MKSRIPSSIFLLALTTSAFAGGPTTMEPETVTPANFYVGAFGGGGASNNFNASQFGTVFITEAGGGPLAVNAFSQLNSESTSFFGGQIGYQARGRCFVPAAELEAYSMGKRSFSGTLVNNADPARILERNFVVTYPMNRAVFLANAVLNFNSSRFPVHPYVGLGIGDALVRITGAVSTQINPPEAGVNHYNSNPGDTDSAFAGQVKAGLSYDINSYLSLFADYRWLYIANTHFVFGPTVYASHAATSSWQVNLNAQKYNLGDVGIRFKF